MPDEHGQVDVQRQRGNEEIIAKALSVMVSKCQNGILKISAREVALMPRGTLAFAMSNIDGSITFAFSDVADPDRQATFPIALPDSAEAHANSIIHRQAMAVLTLNAGGSLKITARDLLVFHQDEWHFAWQPDGEGGMVFGVEKIG